MSEAQVLRGIVAYAKACGCEVIRMSFRHGVATGWPDLCIVAPEGRVGFLEVKAPGKKPSPLQEARLADLARRDVAQGWTDNEENGYAFVSALMEGWFDCR